MCSKLAAKQFIKQLESEGKQNTEYCEKRSGNIINISSVHEESVATGQGAYAISKSDLNNLTRAMTLELVEYGIHVNDVSSGVIFTPMNQESVDDLKKCTENEEQIPLKQAGISEDIVNMIVFLCSDGEKLLYRCHISCRWWIDVNRSGYLIIYIIIDKIESILFIQEFS
ncbi:unnamed protein product [Rotaria sp. Silwood2]|nr:unnamed protein product [Rotaria sp. Silwood2]CAF2815381.1 unnamed protein product [Rotaria sp. Silwood2]CAF4083888.1 unnamed protein product [Rotaria sp. Silwood2]